MEEVTDDYEKSEDDDDEDAITVETTAEDDELPTGIVLQLGEDRMLGGYRFLIPVGICLHERYWARGFMLEPISHPGCKVHPSSPVGTIWGVTPDDVFRAEYGAFCRRAVSDGDSRINLAVKRSNYDEDGNLLQPLPKCEIIGYISTSHVPVPERFDFSFGRYHFIISIVRERDTPEHAKSKPDIGWLNIGRLDVQAGRHWRQGPRFCPSLFLVTPWVTLGCGFPTVFMVVQPGWLKVWIFGVQLSGYTVDNKPVLKLVDPDAWKKHYPDMLWRVFQRHLLKGYARVPEWEELVTSTTKEVAERVVPLLVVSKVFRSLETNFVGSKVVEIHPYLIEIPPISGNVLTNREG